jgi:hypothetical protein
VAALQESEVHGFPSSTVTDCPLQTPLPSHRSLVVQALLSLQGVRFRAFVPATQFPVRGAQVSVPLQTLPSSQIFGVPAVHCPLPLQWSPVVQASPSLQMVEAGALVPARQVPVLGWQVSVPLQGLESSQIFSVPARHCPLPLQWSSVVQALPSLQGVVGGDGVLVQVPPLQWSCSVQGLPSLQLAASLVTLVQWAPGVVVPPCTHFAIRQGELGVGQSESRLHGPTAAEFVCVSVCDDFPQPTTRSSSERSTKSVDLLRAALFWFGYFFARGAVGI